MRSPIRIVLTGIVAFLAVSAHAQSITTFDIPGSTDTQPFSINDSGAVTGQYYDGSHYHGFIRIETAFTYSPSNPVTGSPVSFDASSSTCPASPCSYSWTDDADNSLLGTGVQMSFTFRDPGTKHVRLTIIDAQSQSASVERDVLVSPYTPPVPAFTYSPSNPVTGSPVSFDGSSSTCPASPCSYSWTDDADSSLLGTGVRMSFTFSDPGTKYVRLTITDAQSQSASVEHDVVVSQ